ncbi:MAG: hypothetical protein QG599_1928 [Pseudomonadota bacterium]|nr:hypothetical protein [Pseudomonadota bacterium]
MKINIQARGFELTDRLREHTERHLRHTLGWADDHLRQVSVRLYGQSGPRRGKDTRCRIQIDLPGVQDLVIEDIQTDLYVAIDRAANRVCHLLARLLLERQRDLRYSLLSQAKSDDKVALSPH